MKHKLKLLSTISFVIVFCIGWLSVQVTVAFNPDTDQSPFTVIRYDGSDEMAEDIAVHMTDNDLCEEVIVTPWNGDLEFNIGNDKVIGPLPSGGMIMITVIDDRRWVVLIRRDGYHQYWKK